MHPINTRPQYVDEITVYIRSLEINIGPDIKTVVNLDLTVQQALDLAEWLVINDANKQDVFNVIRSVNDALKAESC